MNVLDIIVETDLQRLFDIIVEKLAAQGSCCASGSGENATCLYTEGERRCAVGHVLKPEYLTRELTSVGNLRHLLKAVNAESLVARYVPHAFTIPEDAAAKVEYLLSCLQHAHDENYRRWNVSEELREIARQFELSAASVNKHMHAEWIAEETWK